jgi:hypothetical protein
MTKLFRKFFLGVSFILILGMLVGVISANAVEMYEEPTTEDCQTCHPIIQDFWENGLATPPIRIIQMKSCPQMYLRDYVDNATSQR